MRKIKRNILPDIYFIYLDANIDEIKLKDKLLVLKQKNEIYRWEEIPTELLDSKKEYIFYNYFQRDISYNNPPEVYCLTVDEIPEKKSQVWDEIVKFHKKYKIIKKIRKIL